MIPKSCRLFGQDHAKNQRESRALSGQRYRKTLYGEIDAYLKSFQRPRKAARRRHLRAKRRADRAVRRGEEG
jgi:hypothetical protein